jgi:hypothetical protein
MYLKNLSLAAALAFALPAQAALTHDVADITGPTVMADFEAFDGYYTMGPEVVAPGVTFTGDADSVLGAYIADLGSNGVWGYGNAFAATGTIGELRFTFDNLTHAAGALVNHFAMAEFPFAVVVSAYGDNNQIIETYTLSIATDAMSENEGLFLGITRASADIRSLSFKGNALVVDNLVAAVPEPEAYALMLAGLGLVGFMARSRQAKDHLADRM